MTQMMILSWHFLHHHLADVIEERIFVHQNSHENFWKKNNTWEIVTQPNHNWSYIKFSTLKTLNFSSLSGLPGRIRTVAHLISSSIFLPRGIDLAQSRPIPRISFPQPRLNCSFCLNWHLEDEFFNRGHNHTPNL